MIAAYRGVFQHLSWQALPFGEKLIYTEDDACIRATLLKLRQLDPTTPLPAVFESTATDLHYVMVGYEQQLVLYWFTHYSQPGDTGYRLYRIDHLIDPTFNFLAYGHQFDLPEASMAKVYMEVFSRLNDWARLLELPYRYEVDLREGYMGYAKNLDPVTRLVQEKQPALSPISLWRRLWTRWRSE